MYLDGFWRLEFGWALGSRILVLFNVGLLRASALNSKPLILKPSNPPKDYKLKPLSPAGKQKRSSSQEHHREN